MHLHRVVVQLLRHRFMSMCDLSFGPPRRLVSLLDEDAEVRGDCLQQLQTWWSALEQLEANIDDDAAAADFHTRLVWPLWDGCREIFVALDEVEFKGGARAHRWNVAALLSWLDYAKRL